MVSRRVLRGGFYRISYNTQSASRNYGKPDGWGYGLGFRLVREPESPRVVRGGSWFSHPYLTLSAFRGSDDAAYRGRSHGFRLVRERI